MSQQLGHAFSKHRSHKADVVSLFAVLSPRVFAGSSPRRCRRNP
jgi:hypothetical protein